MHGATHIKVNFTNFVAYTKDYMPGTVFNNNLVIVPLKMVIIRRNVSGWLY
jgi:hypothetical protein